MNIDTKKLEAVSFISATLGHPFSLEENDSLFWDHESCFNMQKFAVELDCARNKIMTHEALLPILYWAIRGWAYEHGFALSQIEEEDCQIEPKREPLIPEAAYRNMRKEMERRQAIRASKPGN